MSSPSRSKKSSPNKSRSRKNKEVINADEINRRLKKIEEEIGELSLNSQYNFNTPSALQSSLPNRGYHPLTGFTINRSKKYGGKKRTRKGKKTRKGKGKKSRKTRK
jgi:hypothetical protein